MGNPKYSEGFKAFRKGDRDGWLRKSETHSLVVRVLKIRIPRMVAAKNAWYKEYC